MKSTIIICNIFYIIFLFLEIFFGQSSKSLILEKAINVNIFWMEGVVYNKRMESFSKKHTFSQNKEFTVNGEQPH